MTGRRSAVTLVLVLLVATLLLGVGAANSAGGLLVESTAKVSVSVSSVSPRRSPPPDPDQDAKNWQRFAQHNEHQSDWVTVVGGVLALGIGVALLCYVIRMLREHGLTFRTRPDHTAHASGDVVEYDDELGTQVRASARAALQGLDAGASPTDAIVACWRAMARAAIDHGVPRRATDTSTEFATAIARRTHVDAAALADLAELYRRAMFDDWTAEATDLAHAQECLEQIVGEWQRA